jgi:catechol-2,3-dioxygenase
MNDGAIHPQVRIGHVHLKVADLDRALQFYCGVLGFEVTQQYGPAAAFTRRLDLNGLLREARQTLVASAPGPGPRDPG